VCPSAPSSSVAALIHGLEPDDEGRQPDVAELPPPRYAVKVGAVHLIKHLQPTIGACGCLLVQAELHHRMPPGRRCRGCWGDEAVAVAVRRP
jgi:hypothetical protein